jgi:CDP-glucose 4,6-dehydratase
MNKSLGEGLKALNGPILVTGHTGFKGTWLTLLLEKLDIQVVGLAKAPLENSLYNKLNRTGSIEEVIGDIRDNSVVESAFERFKPSSVIHLAAQPLVSESYKTPVLTFETNVIGSANILESGINCKSVKGIIAVTTDKVYKNEELGLKFKETDPLEGKDPYSASKVGSEAVISAWQQISKLKNGPQICSARAGNVIGGGDYTEGRLMKDIVNSLLNNENLAVRNPKSTRPWQHVLDPLRGYIMLLESSIENGNSLEMNFGPTEESLSVEEVLRKSQSYWGAISDSTMSNCLNASRTYTDFKESVKLDLDSTLARSLLGWQPKWNQLESIERTLKWWHSLECENKDVTELCLLEIQDVFL